MPESKRMWLLNQVGHSQWEPCLPELLWKKHRHLPRSWKRPVGLFQGSERESHWNEEGWFAAELLENHCPHKQMAIFQLVLEGVRKKRKDSFFPDSQYLVFLRRSWPSLHPSIISKGTRLWEALLPLWKCVQNAAQGFRECTVLPAFWIVFPPGIPVALE